MLNVDLVGCTSLSSNDSAKKVQTRTELSLLKLCRAQPFLNHDAKIRQFSDTTKFQRVIRRDFSTLSIRNLLNNLTRRFAPRNSYFFRRENIELST